MVGLNMRYRFRLTGGQRIILWSVLLVGFVYDVRIYLWLRMLSQFRMNVSMLYKDSKMIGNV